LALLALTGCGGGAGSCTKNQDCVSGQLCVSGQCLGRDSGAARRCTDETDCEEGEFCDFFDKVCRRPGEDDAGPERDATVGRDGSPGDGPRMDGTVGPVPDGGVQPGPDGGDAGPDLGTCQQDEQCPPGPPTAVCISDVCRYGCGVDPSLCARGTEVCNTNTGHCEVLVQNCTIDTDCVPAPPARVCEGTQCVPGCAQPGGVVCGGVTPLCNQGTGRCGAPPSCNLDVDCGNVDQICVNLACLTRCDRPGGLACSPGVCNTTTGRCTATNQPLGADCSEHAECVSGFCLVLGGGFGFCSAPCGRTTECDQSQPIGCFPVDDMGFCVPGSIFNPPAILNTPVGGSCNMAVNECKSGVCDTGISRCLERCFSNSRCAGEGGNCWAWLPGGQTSYIHMCVTNSQQAAGTTCSANTQCRSGICNRYTGRCVSHCCADGDCAVGESCGIYDIVSQQEGIKVCRPKSPGAGNLPHGSACTLDSECDSEYCVPLDPLNPQSAKKCSVSCCADIDCNVVPNGGTCRPRIINLGQQSTSVGVCIPR
jgi:hypothetical protein